MLDDETRSRHLSSLYRWIIVIVSILNAFNIYTINDYWLDGYRIDGWSDVVLHYLFLHLSPIQMWLILLLSLAITGVIHVYMTRRKRLFSDKQIAFSKVFIVLALYVNSCARVAAFFFSLELNWQSRLAVGTFMGGLSSFARFSQPEFWLVIYSLIFAACVYIALSFSDSFE